MLSSTLPWLRPRRRLTISSSGQSKKITMSGSVPTILSKAILFSSHLGKPSIRTLLALFISIAFLMSSTVISDGTILPSFMISRINSPFSLPDAISCRRISPALRWANPKSEAILVHCVPLPLPGPPKTKAIKGFWVSPPSLPAWDVKSLARRLRARGSSLGRRWWRRLWQAEEAEEEVRGDRRRAPTRLRHISSPRTR